MRPIAQLQSFLREGHYAVPGCTRGVGRFIGARLKPNSPAEEVSLSSTVRPEGKIGAEFSERSLTAPFLRDADVLLPAMRGMADAMVASGRLGFMALMGGMIGMGAFAIGAPLFIALPLSITGLATELTLDCWLGIAEGVVIEKLMDNLVKTEDNIQRKRCLLFLMEFIGPYEIMDRLSERFLLTKDLSEAGNIAGGLGTFTQNFISDLLEVYVNSQLSIKYPAYGFVKRTAGDFIEAMKRYETRKECEKERLFNENPLLIKTRNFWRGLEQKVAIWNPRSWFRPLIKEKRKLLGII